MIRSGQLLLSVTLLASAGGLLFGVLSQQQWLASEQSIQKARAPADDSAAEVQPLLVEETMEPMPLSEFVEMTARPLFSPSRRPPPATGDDLVSDTQQEDTVGTPETNRFSVMGIVIALDEKIALLKELKNSDEIVHVKEGQALSGWTVLEITPESVTIEQSGITEVVKLSDNVLSDTEKQQLMQQAKQEQIKAVNKQNLVIRRSNISSDRQRAGKSTRRIRANPRIQNR